MTTDDLLMGRWRDKNERASLVEQLIAEKRKNRDLSDELRRVTAVQGSNVDILALVERWKAEGTPGVRAELVDQDIAVPRRKARAAIEALDLDPAVVRAVVIDRFTLTVVRRDDRSFRYAILEDQ